MADTPAEGYTILPVLVITFPGSLFISERNAVRFDNRIRLTSYAACAG
jgi:hypothetical protein